MVMVRGEPLRRPKGTTPPCRGGKGCPKGTPENSNALSPKNEEAYQHYLECRAVGQFPDDMIVKKNAKRIRMIEDWVHEQQLANGVNLAGLRAMIGK